MKTGPFAEHSNQLWNISAVPSWSKVNQGLIRMYKAEVRLLSPPIPHPPVSLTIHQSDKQLAVESKSKTQREQFKSEVYRSDKQGQF